MDAIEYLIEVSRMCKEYDCDDCPLNVLDGDSKRCIEGDVRYAQMSVEVVKDWSEKHPFHVVTTNGDMVTRILDPKAKANIRVNGRHIDVIEDEAIIIAVKSDWWDKEYKGDIKC